MDKYDLLKKIQGIDPQSLIDAHDELIGGFDKNGQPIGLGDPVFEVDGQFHRIPFQQLRDVLQGKEPKRSKSTQEVFRGRIPKLPEANTLEAALRGASAVSDNNFNEDSPNGDYYWDSNYNYEYMNPESKMRKVLGKIKR